MEGKLRSFAAGRKDLTESFLTAYPALCQEAAKRLRSLYNPTDYPPLEYVAQQFTLIWQYISFGVPDQLREISTKIWHDEREKAAEMMAEAGREIQQVLRTAMGELVKHMRDRLKDGPEGKPLRFKETTVTNLVDFLGTYIPLPRTELERQRWGDGRPSIERRYADKPAYLATAARGAESLARDGLLLREDVPWVLERAEQHWDWVMRRR